MFTEYGSREEASGAVAETISSRVSARLATKEDAAIVVSGGSTPRRAFELLGCKDFDWSRLHIVPSDERWVEPSAEDSNERMIRESLLADRGVDAQLLTMFAANSAIDDRCRELSEQLRTLPLPFSVSLLGMGEDGHFASLFPDAANLDKGLQQESSDWCMPVSTAASPHPRISLTLSALLNSEEILLLIFGDKKRHVLEQASKDSGNYPVAQLLKQNTTPVRTFWAA
jgi:6-phosphogluconolactonase